VHCKCQEELIGIFHLINGIFKMIGTNNYILCDNIYVKK
jgi:hypothetical protein